MGCCVDRASTCRASPPSRHPFVASAGISGFAHSASGPRCTPVDSGTAATLDGCTTPTLARCAAICSALWPCLLFIAVPAHGCFALQPLVAYYLHSVLAPLCTTPLPPFVNPSFSDPPSLGSTERLHGPAHLCKGCYGRPRRKAETKRAFARQRQTACAEGGSVGTSCPCLSSGPWPGNHHSH